MIPEDLPGAREIGRLLEPFGVKADEALLGQLATYLELLVRWNARTNLTSIRDPRQMVTRHFGESLFAARHLPPAATLLDYGSGAGFPGLPIQLVRPELRVTLAESQHRKASFLREAVRTLGLATEVWPDRVAAMSPARTFEIVTLRAVDDMEHALEDAWEHCAPGGWVVSLESGSPGDTASKDVVFAIPEPGRGAVRMRQRL